jgi:aerobic-type carbon monoxide dehydrogenase small subunit (CoxS/CutS family)
VQAADEPSVVIECKLNGKRVRSLTSVRRSLVDWLRHDIGLTGTHVGCEHGVCGACNVSVDGSVVRGCLMLAVQVEGRIVETIEGASESGRIEVLQNAFFSRAALQCGFCTPGMLMQAAELLATINRPTRDQIRDALSGNLCRCTGYEAIIDAVEVASQETSGSSE